MKSRLPIIILHIFLVRLLPNEIMKSYSNTYTEKIRFIHEGREFVFNDWRSILSFFGLKLVNNAKMKAQHHFDALKIPYTYTITTVAVYRSSYDNTYAYGKTKKQTNG